MAHRGLSPSSCDIHCGFDGGQGVLKLALTITDRLEDIPTGRSHYSDVSKRSTLNNIQYSIQYYDIFLGS